MTQLGSSVTCARALHSSSKSAFRPPPRRKPARRSRTRTPRATAPTAGDMELRIRAGTSRRPPHRGDMERAERTTPTRAPFPTHSAARKRGDGRPVLPPVPPRRLRLAPARQRREALVRCVEWRIHAHPLSLDISRGPAEIGETPPSQRLLDATTGQTRMSILVPQHAPTVSTSLGFRA